MDGIGNDVYDVVIVGAGPAGSSFARMLSEDLRVLLIDGSGEMGKVCGGLLSPDAQDLFAKYNLPLPTSILASPQLFRVRTHDLHSGQTRDYRRSYLNLDRRGFDRYLLSLVPHGVEIIRAKCRQISRDKDGFLLTVEDGEGRRQVRTRITVGADGAFSTVRRSLFPERKMPLYTAIQEWYDAKDENPFYSCVFDQTTSDSYSWVFFKDGKQIFGGAFRPQGAQKAFEAQREKLVGQRMLSAFASAHPIRREACCVAMPEKFSHLFIGRQNAYLLGEAAGLISPSSLEGISYAMLSAQALAQSINRSPFTKSTAILQGYRLRLLPLYFKIGLRFFKRAVLCSSHLRHLILWSGICALPQVKLEQKIQFNGNEE